MTEVEQQFHARVLNAGTPCAAKPERENRGSLFRPIMAPAPRPHRFRTRDITMGDRTVGMVSSCDACGETVEVRFDG